MHACIYTPICLYTMFIMCSYVCVCVYTHICTYIYIYIHIYIYMYILGFGMCVCKQLQCYLYAMCMYIYNYQLHCACCKTCPWSLYHAQRLKLVHAKVFRDCWPDLFHHTTVRFEATRIARNPMKYLWGPQPLHGRHLAPFQLHWSAAKAQPETATAFC